MSGYLALKSVFGWASNELACSGFREKLSRERLNDVNLQRYTVGLRILALYCQRQKMVQETYFMAVGSCRYSREFAREGVLNESEVFENGDFCFFRSL